MTQSDTIAGEGARIAINLDKSNNTGMGARYAREGVREAVIRVSEQPE